MSAPSLVKAFEAALIQAGGQVVRTTRSDLETVINEEARAIGTRTFACWDDLQLKDVKLAGLLYGGGLEPVCPSEAGLGVIRAERGLASTGSAVVTSGPGRPRSVSILPPALFIILDASRLLPGIPDLCREIAGWARSGGLPANIALITGPSRSGDIEMELSIGVHGPGRVTVFLIEDD